MSRRQKAPATSTRRRRPRRAALRSADGAKRFALTSFPGRPTIPAIIFDDDEIDAEMREPGQEKALRSRPKWFGSELLKPRV